MLEQADLPHVEIGDVRVFERSETEAMDDKDAARHSYDGALDLLREIEESAFFQQIRGGLVTGLYNQKEVWPLFGYEGESYSKGGYIERGFNDINWL